MGRKTYLGGSTTLQLSPTATSDWRLSGPYGAQGKASVKNAGARKRPATQKTIDAMNESDQRKLARRRAENPGRLS